MTMSPLDRPPGLDALFDLTFTRFVTISVVRIIYLLGMLLLAVLWLIMVVAGFMQGVLAGLVGIIVATIIAAIYLLMMRVWLEVIVVLFRIGENTTAMARSMGVGPPTGGFPVMPTQPMPSAPV
jgi:hypothetical protein